MLTFLEYRDGEAIRAGERSFSYGDVLQAAADYAELLGSIPGGKVALYCENRPEWAYVFYAAWLRSMVVVPIDHQAPADDVAFILKDCTPDILVCSNETYEKASEAIREGHRRCTLINLDQLPAERPAAPEVKSIGGEAETPAVILYTSGTTGSPKGVVLTFNNLLVNLSSVIQAGFFAPDQRVLVMLPLHHILPLAGTLLAPLHNGATIVFTPSISPTDIVETLQAHAVTTLIAVPRFYSLITGNIRSKIAASPVARLLYGLAERLRSPAFSRIVFKKIHDRFGGHMQFMISGGAPLDPAVADCLEVLGFRVYEGYGMTEAAPIITFPRPDAPRAGSCGKPLDINEVRIVDGEIVTRGPNVMKEYYGRPQETAQTIRDGWLHTGDTGYFDHDGYLFVTGRLKDIIVLPSGKNVNPQEIEEKWQAMHPEIDEVGVFQHHSTLRALVRFRDDFARERSAEDLEDHAQSRILAPYNAGAAPYKRISGIRLVQEELPRTRLGKIRRFRLPELDERAAKTRTKSPPRPEPASATYKRIKEFMGHLVPVPVMPDASLSDDLGIDSLARVSLQVFIEESFGVQLAERDFSVLATPRLLAERVDRSKSKDAETAITWKDILTDRPSLTLPATSWLHTSVILLSRGLARLYFRLSIHGREHIPTGPCIFVANHQSFIDGLLLGAAVPVDTMKKTYFYAKEEHVRKPLARYMADRCNIIVVDINHRLMESIQKMSIVLRRGYNIIIFPEGSRTLDGHMGDFRPTFAILSNELGIPIVPMVIDGAYEAMPRGRVIPRFMRRIKLTILPPLEPGEMDYDEITDTVRERIESVLQNRKNSY